MRIIDVENRSQLRDFIDLPKRLYRDIPSFIPALDSERHQAFSPKTNPYFGHAKAKLFMAYRNGEPVGRISAQYCDLYRAKHGTDIGHFGFLDAVEDRQVVHQLLMRAEEWLGSLGARSVLGPFHFSSNEETGMMVEGFDARSVIMMPYHPPYLGPMVEESGYEKAKDVIAYDLDTHRYKPMGQGRFIQRIASESRIAIRPLNNLELDLTEMLDIFNDAWSGNWGMIPFTTEEAKAAIKALKPIIIPSLVRIAEIDGKAVAMMLCLPNLNEAIRDLEGKLLPFGWVKLLWRLKARRIESARIPLMGIRKEYHHTPVASALLSLLFDSLVEPAMAWGFKNIELSWILEDNLPMRRVIEAVGGEQYKTYRLYRKSLP